MKLVHRREAEHGLIVEIHHDKEQKVLLARVHSDELNIDAKAAFEGHATLDTAKAWGAEKVDQALAVVRTPCPCCGAPYVA